MLPGIDFKSKMIGIEPVGEARGDKMCMDAMIKLKYLVKTSGEHKARIIINVSIEGIRILDEKTREVLHQHEVHRISFISRDPTDPRAFGYVYGEQGNHKFYGIKTEKQADALVLTLKDLFEVVLDLKKQQIAQQKKAEQLTSSSPPTEDNNSEPKQVVSFKNPPPAEGTVNGSDPIYAQVDKPKLTALAAELDTASPPSSGLLDLEQEVKNIQMVRHFMMGTLNYHLGE
nr:disabled homolog 2-like [Lytechinus pictus]